MSGVAGVTPGAIPLHGDGEELALEASTHPVADDAGNVIGSVASFTDITHRRKLEERLARYAHLALLGQLTGYR